MNPHRVPAERDERPDHVPLHMGPRDTCPACKASNAARCDLCQTDASIGLTDPPGRCPAPCHEKRRRVERVASGTFCSPTDRVRVGWLRRCRVSGAHLHQCCNACGASWLCATVEALS